MATFTVPANTQIDSDATFGPLGVSDLEQVFGTAIDTSVNGGEQDVELNGIANLTTINSFGFQEVLLGGFSTAGFRRFSALRAIRSSTAAAYRTFSILP